jgi:hypothetical protein
MKTIETRYAGYRFRSRLEARWAVFFDALGARWEYEPEGFKLPSGKRYLPDFKLLLRGRGVFVEVKPSPSSDADWRKAIEFARAEPILLLAGPPRVRRFDTLALPASYDMARLVRGDSHLGPLGWGLHREWIVRLSAFLEARDESGAVEASRSARFEFGESGAA